MTVFFKLLSTIVYKKNYKWY